MNLYPVDKYHAHAGEEEMGHGALGDAESAAEHPEPFAAEPGSFFGAIGAMPGGNSGRFRESNLGANLGGGRAASEGATWGRTGGGPSGRTGGRGGKPAGSFLVRREPLTACGIHPTVGCSMPAESNGTLPELSELADTLASHSPEPMSNEQVPRLATLRAN
ncbi:hypothetical protein T492DRAFT_425301 [Pavlovales sp. CCMP2436]|nr:hypothetical protein T492DRAFT_425301 [Pavlovales sp. CCMP2436]